MAVHSSSSCSIRSSSLMLERSLTSAAGAADSALAALSASLASRSRRSSSRISAMISSPSASSSTTASAPRLTVEQSTSSRGGRLCSGSVLVLPVATPVPNAPSCAGSNAPTARAHRIFEGERTIMVGKSISDSSKCAAKPVWQVASIHEKDRGPPARLCLSFVIISMCASLFVFSELPSSMMIAQSPPLLVHSSSKLAFDSSTRGVGTPLLALASCVDALSAFRSSALPDCPNCISRWSTKSPMNFAMFP
mmetsp:Transcript_21209/g.35004  ORF Transcript_21209/g.35004 Transcript_21209/m.35004 type:complete len:251 (-) Transcript_21209:1455-2207(-)